jgi:DNA-binding MarR family transcriptional regulator
VSKPLSATPPLAVGALLRFALDHLRARIYAGVVSAGFDDVRPAHVTLFRWPGPDGQRPTAIAAAVGITKQSVNDLLRDLERLGYLTLEEDPTDDRARVIALTARGRRLHRTAIAVHAQIERDWTRALGAREFAALTRGLQRITQDLVPAGAVSSSRWPARPSSPIARSASTGKSRARATSRAGTAAPKPPPTGTRRN